MNPFAGTWTANLAKSQRHENHQFHSATLRFDVTDTAVTMTHGGVNMSGKQESGSQTYYPDGKERPLSLSTGSGQAQQMPNITIASTWVGTHVLETSAKRDGQPLGQGSYEVSDDNRVLTATVRGVDAAGKPFAQVIVFDRD
ncbi:MAG: hypothetical protein AUH43_08590 [Acidobacteria bacterium 13_1_40CM_65_14]|jgi:hypothetical protein|nr:MAG: hypothetical protein AUH43_08590 [Acidobacteria bacterium 13_1_40CM_65_14]OLC78097.1 MAG: hypothetical protein AUH72_16630 [Acidobacteria bacterium 13_1_40CM_4_65_8]